MMKKTANLLILLGLFLVLALAVAAGLTENLDQRLAFQAIGQSGSLLTDFFLLVTHAGDMIPVILLGLLPFFHPDLRRTLARPLALGLLLSTGLNLLLKELFARERPDLGSLLVESSYSFPSGHAMINATLYLILLYYAWHHLKKPVWRFLAAAVCLALPLAISYSRVYLGVHFASDVLGGFLLGSLVAFLIIRSTGQELRGDGEEEA